MHAIVDDSAVPFVEELTQAVHERARSLRRLVQVMPESASNNPRLVQRTELGGYGMDAQWSDDFHHSLHVLLTGEQAGYYRDFSGVEDLAKAFREGFVNTERYSPFFQRRHGRPSRDVPAQRLIIFSQNHDQIGNRMRGDRLTALASFEAAKVAAAAVLLSPFIPMLFMGEEYGEQRPFQYFVSHSDPGLVEAVRRGRREEFVAFGWQGDVPDPQDEATFLASKLDWREKQSAKGAALHAFYRELLRLRKALPALASLDKQQMNVIANEAAGALLVHRWHAGNEVLLALNFSSRPASVPSQTVKGKAKDWRRILDSSEGRWLGAGAPDIGDSSDNKEMTISLAALSCAVFLKEEP